MEKKLWSRIEMSLEAYGERMALMEIQEVSLSVSYRELLHSVRSSADRLRGWIPEGSIVTVLDENSFFEVTSILALISLQVTIVPLASTYGDARCRDIISHTEPDFLVTSSEEALSPEVLRACSEAGTIIVSNDSKPLAPVQEKRTPRAAPDSFIMYTSGSTGKPKGALLSHSNIAANIDGIRTYFPVHSEDRLLIHRSLSHASVLTGELLYGLLNGACLVFYHEPFHPRRMLRFMEEQRITVMGTTPTIFYKLALDRSDYGLDGLRQVALMGEFLHQQVAKQVRERFAHVKFFMLYGQTEASPRITYLAPEWFGVKEGCIGTVLPGMEFRIAQVDGKTVGEGEIGELVVKGANIFRGYWRQPHLTAMKLRDGWLYTGDMVYQGKDGFLYIAGRKDDMMIRAGMNIYPIEVENALLQDPRVREVIVFGTPDPRYGQKIHVHVVPVEREGLTKGDVMVLCKQRLSSYQYPDEVEIVDEIPRSAAGKTIRRKTV
jgi:long-chain acyl-CoA synthetase